MLAVTLLGAWPSPCPAAALLLMLMLLLMMHPQHVLVVLGAVLSVCREHLSMYHSMVISEHGMYDVQHDHQALRHAASVQQECSSPRAHSSSRAGQ